MNKGILALVLVLSFGLNSWADSTVSNISLQPAGKLSRAEQFQVLRKQKLDPEQYFRVNSLRVQELSAEYPRFDQNAISNCDSKKSRDLSSLVIINEMMNVGEKVWSIVEAGQPVSEYKSNFAHALPQGIDCWTSLYLWQQPMNRSFSVEYKNLYGMTVVDFKYTVTAMTGGKYDGRGAYIANATIVPNQVNVMWGFEFRADAEIPMVMNMGTLENPVAGMQIKMAWAVENVLTSEKRAEVYFLDGLGEFRVLSR